MDNLGFHQTRFPMSIGVWHYLMEGITVTPSRQNDELRRAGKLTGEGDRDLPFASSLENNVASARDLGRLMEMMHKDEIVSRDACAQMIEMMKKPTNPDRIRKFLKPEIEVARKEGGSGRIKADCGVVYLPSGPLFIAALVTTDTRDQSQQGTKAIGNIARLAYEALSPESVRHPEDYEMRMERSSTNLSASFEVLNALVWIFQKPDALKTVDTNDRPLSCGPGRGGSQHRSCFTSELRVIIPAVIELDRTAGVGHKPPRRLSGTFLPTLLVTKEWVGAVGAPN